MIPGCAVSALLLLGSEADVGFTDDDIGSGAKTVIETWPIHHFCFCDRLFVLFWIEL
jgi:hypothetical protein